LGREEVVEIAKLRRIKPWQEEERYIQALLLYSLSGEPLVFKGGTYLWFFHGLNRFSDDLDFTARGRVGMELIDTAGERLRLFGVENETRLVKEDRHILSFRVSAKGPLFASDKDICHIYVEVSRREETKTESLPIRLDEAHYGIPLVFLRGMALIEVASEKVRAVMTRSAARDLYDLWYVTSRLRVEPDVRLINEKLAFYGMSFNYGRFRERIGAFGRFWGEELKPLVFGILPEFGGVLRDLEETFSKTEGS